MARRTLGRVITEGSTATDCWPPLPGPARTAALKVAAIAFVIDLLAVIAFAAIGRRSHDEERGVALTFEVAAPFLLGVAAGWAIFRMWRSPLWSNRAIGMWLTTVVVGIVVRRTVFGRGIAPSFVIVATIVLGVLLLGWRFLMVRFARWAAPEHAE